MSKLLIVLFTLTCTSFIADQNQTGNLEIELVNLASDDGLVLVGIYNRKSDWLKTQYTGKTAIIKDGIAKITFKDLPYGEYAISCFHDINNNNDLDTGFLGLPIEPYAFSNSVNSWFGPPKWNKVTFEVSSPRKTILIKF